MRDDGDTYYTHSCTSACAALILASFSDPRRFSLATILFILAFILVVLAFILFISSVFALAAWNCSSSNIIMYEYSVHANESYWLASIRGNKAWPTDWLTDWLSQIRCQASSLTRFVCLLFGCMSAAVIEIVCLPMCRSGVHLSMSTATTHSQ